MSFLHFLFAACPSFLFEVAGGQLSHVSLSWPLSLTYEHRIIVVGKRSENTSPYSKVVNSVTFEPRSGFFIFFSIDEPSALFFVSFQLNFQHEKMQQEGR